MDLLSFYISYNPPCLISLQQVEKPFIRLCYQQERQESKYPCCRDVHVISAVDERHTHYFAVLILIPVQKVAEKRLKNYPSPAVVEEDAVAAEEEKEDNDDGENTAFPLSHSVFNVVSF